MGNLASWAQEAPTWKRILPPEGIEIPADVREKLTSQLAELEKRLSALSETNTQADVAIFLKAVRYALLHKEFYGPKDFEKADKLLKAAADRLDEIHES